MQRPSTTPVSPPSNESALRGATLAFRALPSPSNKNVLVSASSYGGALAAASKAVTGPSPLSRPSAVVQKLEKVNTGDVSLTAGWKSLSRNHSQTENVAKMSTAAIERETSTSYIAATRAASRSRPLMKHDAFMNRTSIHGKMASQTSPGIGNGTAEISIPSTSRLVELFEAKQRSELSSSKHFNEETEIPEFDNIVSPIPIRPSLSIRIRAPALASEVIPDPVKPVQPPKSVPTQPLNSVGRNSTYRIIQSPRKTTKSLSRSNSKAKIPPALPLPKKYTQPKDIQSETRPKLIASVSDEFALSISSPLSNTKSAKVPPKLPPPRRTRPTSIEPQPGLLSPLTRTASTPPILPRRLTHLPFGKLKPQLTADSLANAMVASSLASSRAPSPSHSIRPEPLSRHHSSKSHSIASVLLLHSPTHTPSSPKLHPSKPPGLRQTLRPSPTSSDEEQNTKHRNYQHKHGFLIKKHPNKHAEGTRHHWRDSITERERKRYEGVWAANRGMLIQHETALDATSDQDEVHGFVVRDIFSRSKLGQRVLSEIWELVESGGRSRRQKNIASRARTSDLPPAGDKKRRGRLKRHEFVVGLWLVDQCLKGRKLPLSVRDSVWDSAKVLMSGLRTR